MSSRFMCFLCSSFAGRTFADVVRHIGYVHSYDPHFSVTCGLHGCTHHFTSYGAYRIHLYKSHSAIMKNQPEPVAAAQLSTAASLDLSSEDDQDIGDETTTTALDHDSDVVTSENVKRAAALFLLKTSEKNRIPLSSLNELMRDTQQLIRTVLGRAQSLDDSLDEGTIDPFVGLETTHYQMKYFREQLDLIDPLERTLGYKWETSSGTLKSVPDVCYDIPLLTSLECLLKKSSVLEQIYNPHFLPDGLLGDYCDGEQFKTHPLFGSDPHALQINLYYDEVELCNPIGSYSKVHKLGLFYYALGNIEPRLRSKLSTIQLLCAVKSTVLDEYGMDEILKPFVSDLSKLEKDEGVQLETADGPRIFRGTLSVVSADNLASYDLGGFKNLTRALRRCRICMATEEEMSSKFTSEEFQSRTRLEHNNQCRRIENEKIPTLQRHYKTNYGINRNSILNQLKYFHVVDGLPPDAMHDVLEGVLQMEMKQLLHHCIASRYFTLDVLNDRIKSFPFGPAEASNRPSQISAATFCADDNALKQSASQMWCLGRYLPLLIGDRVLEDDERWRNFVLLLDIVDRILAPVTSMSVVAELHHLIKWHHTEFSRLYPEKSLPPKWHFIVHYPQLIQRYGPLSRIWCMRYEAKNSCFKKIGQSIGNFKNIAKTVCTRHQRMMCYVMADEGFLAWDKTIPGPGSTLEAANCPYSQLMSTTITKRVSWIEVQGTRYKPGSVIIKNISDDDELEVCTIADIVMDDRGRYFLVLNQHSPPEYYSHYHAYIVDKRSSTTTIVCQQQDLCDHHCYTLHQSFDPRLIMHYFLVPKYHIVNIH